MTNDVFFHIVDEIDGRFMNFDSKGFLTNICDQYGLDHVTYLGIDIPSLTETKVYSATTYSDAWCRRYISQDYIKFDPVVIQGMQRMLPLDWSEVRDSSKKIRDFFGEAADFGVGRQGLSFPIRGAHGETALFSINSQMSDREWMKLKRHFTRDFQILAYHFHTHVLEREGIAFPEVRLSPREKECLKWAAAGKTAWETGQILGITDWTVEYFLEQARVKLNAINKVQAVATAIRQRLI